MKYNDFLNKTQLIDQDIICLYQYGSRIYGTHNNNSDYDFICITNNKIQDQLSISEIHVNFYTIEEHQRKIDEHEISALETLFLSSSFILKQHIKFDFTLNLQKLRHSISAKASNSFVKCKKKLTVFEDLNENVGKKSLFHSFRIINFGIQLAKFGIIKDYGSCNKIYENIVSYSDWNTLFEVYKPFYNKMSSEFKKLAPKL